MLGKYGPLKVLKDYMCVQDNILHAEVIILFAQVIILCELDLLCPQDGDNLCKQDRSNILCIRDNTLCAQDNILLTCARNILSK